MIFPKMGRMCYFGIKYNSGARSNVILFGYYSAIFNLQSVVIVGRAPPGRGLGEKWVDGFVSTDLTVGYRVYRVYKGPSP